MDYEERVVIWKKKKRGPPYKSRYAFSKPGGRMFLI